MKIFCVDFSTENLRPLFGMETKGENSSHPLCFCHQSIFLGVEPTQRNCVEGGMGSPSESGKRLFRFHKKCLHFFKTFNCFCYLRGLNFTWVGKKKDVFDQFRQLKHLNWLKQDEGCSKKIFVWKVILDESLIEHVCLCSGLFF